MNDQFKLAEIVLLEPKHRPGMDRLRESLRGLSDRAMFGMIASSESQAVRNPRVPQKITVSVNGLSDYAIEVLRTAELTNDEGVFNLIKRAAELSAECPPRPKTNAAIIKFKRR